MINTTDHAVDKLAGLRVFNCRAGDSRSRVGVHVAGAIHTKCLRD
jgi:hypothetical protein